MVFLISSFLGCSPADQAAAPTEPLLSTANLTPGPTPDIEFDLDEIQHILSAQSRYISGITGSDFVDSLPPWLSAMPPAQFVVNQRLLQGTEYGGNVVIAIYLNAVDLRLGYEQARETVNTPRQLETVGEVAVADHTDLVFIRCFAVVDIQVVSGDPDLLEVYARVLDAKLSRLVCPEPFFP